MGIIEYCTYDKKFYEERLYDFLPDQIFDIHSHTWLREFENLPSIDSGRVAKWISLVAKENSFEDLQQTYHTLLPGKSISTLCFTNVSDTINREVGNQYVLNKTKGTSNRCLALVCPENTSDDIRDYFSKGFIGIKVYLNYAPAYIPPNEIRIFDFLPHHQLDELNRLKGICMLHIPRNLRLRDPVNLAQMVEIEESYPEVKLIIAHIGRAYAIEDVGNSMNIIRNTRKMMFDFSANTNWEVLTTLINNIGPKRIMFGTDLPISRMRAHRVVENGVYYNMTPRGLYGDLKNVPHLREAKDKEKITFLLYESIEAFRIAADKTGLNRREVEDVFYNNAAGLIY